MRTNKKTVFICQSALIASLYVALTFVSALLGLSSGAVQVRLSEALCVLAVFTPSAIPGLAIGCLLANLITGCVVWDVVFGAVATLIGAVGTYLLKKRPILALLPPILSNTVIIPFVLKYAYGLSEGIIYIFITVGIGEIISVGILGFILYKSLIPYKNRIFR